MSKTSIVVLTLVAMTFGAGIGLVAYGVVNRPAPAAAASAPAPGTIRPAVGAIGRLAATGGQDGTLIWVNETGLLSWERAYAERDDAAQLRVLRIYETLDVPDGARVKVIEQRSARMQIEIVDGGLAGRRGWLTSKDLLPA